MRGGGGEQEQIRCSNETVSLKMTLDTYSSDNKSIREGNLKFKRLGAILKALFLYVDAPFIGLCHNKDSSGKGYVHQLGVIKERTQEYIKHPLFCISDYKGEKKYIRPNLYIFHILWTVKEPSTLTVNKVGWSKHKRGLDREEDFVSCSIHASLTPQQLQHWLNVVRDMVLVIYSMTLQQELTIRFKHKTQVAKLKARNQTL